MATTKDQSDLVSYVAFGDSDGNIRIVYRYRDGTTRTVFNGALKSTGIASDSPTWWR